MAIDTAAKRASVQSYTLGLLRPLPELGVSAADRAQAAWFYRGLTYTAPVEPPAVEGRLPTTFVASVPAAAVFRAGTAYANTGELYVCDLPANPVFVRGIAHRNDGAMCINASATPQVYLSGWAMTNAGEVVVTTDAPQVHHNAIPLRHNGAVCMTEIS